MKKLNLTGEVFGQLIALRDDGKNKHGRFNWFCKCSCGNTVVVDISNLRCGNTTSCGCILSPLLKKLKTTHGFATKQQKKRPFYGRWTGMNSRCNDKNSAHYFNYGGRGIKNQWLTFESFKEDMYSSYLEHAAIYGERNTTIERINNDGDYCKENCTWLTLEKQQKNRRPDRRYISTQLAKLTN